MDYANRLNRLADHYERKQRLELISHSQLQSSSRNPQEFLNEKEFCFFRPPNISVPQEDPQIQRFSGLNSEKWKQEIKEKKMRAELKGFQSVSRKIA
jgi:hypothetical protein